MRFSAIWTPTAIDQMSLILRAIPERRSTFAATIKTITETLRTDPLSRGESREGNDRIWFVDSLVVTYSVNEQTRTVEIGSVRLSSFP
jgi:hypothetical protein